MMLRSRAISPMSAIELIVEVTDARADLLGVVVEHRRDRDAVLGEDRRARDRAPEPSGADERDVVLALRAQDLPDLLEQRVGAVADAALPERPNAERSRRICVALMFVYSEISCDEIRSLPIFRACVRTCRYLLRRAATPTVRRSVTC